MKAISNDLLILLKYIVRVSMFRNPFLKTEKLALVHDSALKIIS